MHSSEGTDGSDFYQTFEVRFLGSMQVKHDRGEAQFLPIVTEMTGII